MTGVVLGCSGMVGHAFVRLGLRGLDREAVDVRSLDSVRYGILGNTSFVVNCAAFTQVDLAEDFELEANAVNGAGALHVAARCYELGIPLVHISTDHVFSGRRHQPYTATRDELDPINAYGRSKALGERLIRKSGAEHLIIRTSWVYAPWGRNFVLDVRRALEAGERVRAVDDQYGRPTSAEYLAERTLELLRAGCRGTYHVTDGGECNRYRLAFEVAALTGKTALRVSRCSTAELKLGARRPMCSVLDLTETEDRIGPSRVWTDNLARVLTSPETAL